MRLVTYDLNGSWRAGVVVDEWVVDAAAALDCVAGYMAFMVSGRRQEIPE